MFEPLITLGLIELLHWSLPDRAITFVCGVFLIAVVHIPELGYIYVTQALSLAYPELQLLADPDYLQSGFGVHAEVGLAVMHYAAVVVRKAACARLSFLPFTELLSGVRGDVLAHNSDVAAPIRATLQRKVVHG